MWNFFRWCTHILLAAMTVSIGYTLYIAYWSGLLPLLYISGGVILSILCMLFCKAPPAAGGSGSKVKILYGSIAGVIIILVSWFYGHFVFGWF